MFVGITNTPRDYAWGSVGEISALLGHAASARTEAELWLGAHPGSPSRVVGSDETLLDIVDDIDTGIDTGTDTGIVDGRLPFLLKVLAAGAPLSLQAHPTAEQAAAGFARENAAGIALDAQNRNYKDAYPKPELIYAVSERFEALCGFRRNVEVLEVIDRLAELCGPDGRDTFAEWRGLVEAAPTLRPAFEWLITRADGVEHLLRVLVKTARARPTEFDLVVELAGAYPGDPGIAIALMLNRVSLSPGEALYLPAGNIHAYLRGLGIELMTSSDNVLRGGLTPKHIDVPELLSVLDFTAVGVPYLTGVTVAPGITRFAPAGADFALTRIDAGGKVLISSAAIALCTAGQFRIDGMRAGTTLERGDSVFITADEDELLFHGSGTVFLASSQ